MSQHKNRYYVVWAGLEPGVYDSWQECQLQVTGFKGARYKSYPSRDEAVAAYRGDPREELGLIKSILTHAPKA
ncbi:MAG: RNase H1/viroplasmin domain-containing protein, partial [Muribaculaceae bacterium]|nr:RNase H1/viroplasmin domain-containing protein [Muribaculaceae bacterium]